MRLLNDVVQIYQDYKRYYLSKDTVNNKLVFVMSIVSIFIILAAASGWAINVNAQGDSSRNNSSLGTKTTSIGNSSLIITPWNTGNDRNNGSVSNTG